MKNSHINKVIFAGAGPGAPDLITLRCLSAIKDADLIIYAGSLVNPEILKYAKKNSKTIDSSGMTLSEIISEIKKAWEKKQKVLRLHTGDPAIYGAIAEQMTELDKLKIPYEIIPGVSSVFAAAAEIKSELTTPGTSQTVILTRTSGKTPVPQGQELQKLAQHKATLAIFLSTPFISKITNELICGGYDKNTPVAVIYKASWADQKIIRGNIANIAKKIKKANINRQAIILVGDVLNKKKWQKSKLYDPEFSHNFRNKITSSKAKLISLSSNTNKFKGKIAIFTITKTSLNTAKKITQNKNHCKIFAPQKLKKYCNKSIILYKELGKTLKENWKKFDAFIFIMAAGIVVRYISNLITEKTIDPAVVVCDQYGNYAISLLSGHIGGANRLAEDIAALLNGQPVITTATDNCRIIAFDEMASRENYKIINPKLIKKFNVMLLENKKIAIHLPKNIFDKYYSKNKNLKYITNCSLVNRKNYSGLVTTKKIKIKIPQLIIKKNEQSK
ncbi:MAG TPA: precorrin-4 C(11)-methyltransferase [Victivallales bacterium]|nr:precorrin-4 C(11)-methyltransferase [Victivallales bacterium]HRR06615.1 precorrin-4 C(11)-methyltransferase [Victivallales bacterium]HRR27929.1 precorrin-4 C(11)-methyltransferase [Victivallales bacterium]HRU00635.1 precorrin-4 C(11)-methyltransferase [Victivallales bacterium]